MFQVTAKKEETLHSVLCHPCHKLILFYILVEFLLNLHLNLLNEIGIC